MFHCGGVNAPHARWAGERLAWYGHSASWARRWRCSPVASLAGELSARSAALVPRRSSVVCSWLVRRRRRADVPGGSRSGVVGCRVGDVSCCRRGTCRCFPPLIAPRVVACDRVCWGLVVRWTARRTPSSLAASSGPGCDTSAALLAVLPGFPVGRALLIARAIVSGLVCPANPNR